MISPAMGPPESFRGDRSRPSIRERRVELVAHGLAIAFVVSLVAPMLIEQKTYFVDWGNHLYLLDRQRESIELTGLPSYFLHTQQTGAFYPFFLFYGGTLYAIGGYLAIVFQSSWVAYIALFAAGFAMAYGGTYWLGRTLSLGAIAAHGPAVVVVTSAYYLTNVFGRGAWPEVMAASALPLVIAATVNLVVSPRLRLGSAFLLVVAPVDS